MTSKIPFMSCLFRSEWPKAIFEKYFHVDKTNISSDKRAICKFANDCCNVRYELLTSHYTRGSDGSG